MHERHVVYWENSLLDNKQGKLSFPQKLYLLFDLLISLSFLVLGMAIAFAIANTSDFMPLFCIAALGLGGVLVFLISGLRLLQTLISNKVLTVEGSAEKSSQFVNKVGIVHRLYISGQEFSISKRQEKFLKQGASYRIYFTPYSRTIVNIELVSH